MSQTKTHSCKITSWKQKLEPFIPKIVDCFKEGYDRKTLFSDLLAGITVGIIALPSAMAFAIGGGLSPEKGLYTAIVAGFLISLLGGSRVQIGGPTGAYIVVVADIINRHGYEGLAAATFIAGILLIGMGIARFGALVRFIPYPVTTGFTTGLATVILISQLKDLFGLQIPKVSVEVFERIGQYWEHASTWNPTSFILGCASLTLICVLRKINRRIPGAAVAVVFATIISFVFNLPIETIKTKFGGVPSSAPPFTPPTLSLRIIEDIFPDAITVALLGAIESLLSAMVADGMTGFRHKPNCELIAQGLGNIGSSLFGGIPATGAIARTTANIQMHGRTPISGITHAIVLLVLMLAFAPLAGYIPLCALAAVLLFVAWNMSEFHHFKEIIKGPKSDVLILLITYFLTVIIDLTSAVQVGVLLSACIFLKHMSEKTTIKAYEALSADTGEEIGHPHDPSTTQKKLGAADVQVFEIEGPFFFGVSDLLNEALRFSVQKPRVFILRLRTVPLIDVSGVRALKQFIHKCSSEGISLIVCEARPNIHSILRRTGIEKSLGHQAFFSSLNEALKHGKEVADQPLAKI